MAKIKWGLKLKIKSIFAKRYVSIVLTGIFLVVSVTGVLMFFMIESHAMNSVHAWLGIAMVIIGIYHLIKNFSPFKSYLKYKSASILLVLVLATSTWYAMPKGGELVSPKKDIMKAVFIQPISTVSVFFKKDIQKTINHLRANGIEVKDGSQSLMEVAKLNNKEVKEVFFIFFEKLKD